MAGERLAVVDESLPLFADPEPADVRAVGPRGEKLAPFQGKSKQSAHASWTGAVHATEARSENLTTLRQLWREPRTMNEVATIARLPLSSVCSLKAVLEDELEFVDHEIVQWRGRTTKRSRWRLKA